MKRKATLKDRIRRSQNIDWFKHKSTIKWKIRGAVPPSQAHLRWWQLKDQRRENFRKEAPHHLARAAMNYLIYRYRQSNNLHIYNDFPPKNIFDFWISWLHEIHWNARPEAAGYRSAGYAKDYELRGPISELIHAIEDLKSGVRTKYTEACFTKKKKGDRTDPPAVAYHKQQIGLTCKLLTEIGFRTQADAVKRINRALEHAGMRHGYSLDSVKKWVKSVPDREWEIKAKAYIRTLMTCERNVITNWDNLSNEERQMFHKVCNAPLNDLISIWTNIIEMVIQRFPTYNSLARYKILRLWVTHLRVHEGTWIASPIYKEHYGRFGI